VVDVNGGDLEPLACVEKADGQIHILYKQNEVHSAFYDTNKRLISNIFDINIPGFEQLNGAEIASDDNGGFVFMGKTSLGDQKNLLLQLNLNQEVNSTDLGLSFNGYGIFKGADNFYLLAGDSKHTFVDNNGGLFYEFQPTVIKINDIGQITPYSNSYSGYVGKRFMDVVVTTSNKTFMLFQDRFGGTIQVFNPETWQFYDFESLIGELISITTIGGHPIIIGKKGIVKINPENGGTIGQINLPTNVELVNVEMISDNNLLIYGISLENSKKSVWLAKYNSTDMTILPDWPKIYSDVNGNVEPVSAVSTLDNGYLITGKYTSNSDLKRLYLIKTDENGNTK
jgi:hypothetical protein